MSRLPIRVRLTLAFALAMALVLAATGAFLYVRLQDSLDETIDESLQARAADVSTGMARGVTLGPAGEPDERFAQVLDTSGRVVAASGSAQLETTALLERAAVTDIASSGASWRELDNVSGITGRARVLAVPFEAEGETLVAVVGAALEDRDETLHGFLAVLLVVGPLALLVMSAIGYGLATAALRPVESMQREAAAISASEPGRRLSLPRAQDEIHRLGETLNAMLGRLEDAIERERGFVADAGHELRTPLANLRAELELALRRPRTTDELVRAVRSAAEEAERLARLAEDLLLIARSDQGQLALRREEIAAAELLQAVAARFETRMRAARRTIGVDTPTPLVIEGDRARLEQALGNLVENALVHGGGAVLLTAAPVNGHVELHVTDATGQGFPQAFLPRAFDRFSAADAARTGRGTGLGLAIAEAIANAHGGSAHVANRVPAGADVWLDIPAASDRR
jgi:heavy metal sensor kinase